jgi:3-oxoadipate enol-lactonase
MTDALPLGIPVPIAGRGDMRVHDLGGDHPGPALLLLHGWNIDGPTNWANVVGDLADRRRVIVIDHHGHGNGVRPDGQFRLEHCAIDALCALDQLGVEDVIPVGYSMGGAVAQLLARRAPKRCRGMITVATAGCFNTTRSEQIQFAALSSIAAAARRTPKRALRPISERVMRIACAPYPDWVLDVVRAADAVSLLEAGAEVGRFDSRSWSATITQPTSVIVTTQDTVVSPAKQRAFAESLPNAELIELDHDHDMPLRFNRRFSDALRTAADSVVTRMDPCIPIAEHPEQSASSEASASSFSPPS